MPLFVEYLDLSLCSAEALTGVSSGASIRPPCFSKLCDPVPKYEFREGGGRIFWIDIALQNIRGIEFYVHQVLVYHVSGTGIEHILYFVWMDFRGYGLAYLVATLSLSGVARLFRRGIEEFTNAYNWKING